MPKIVNKQKKGAAQRKATVEKSRNRAIRMAPEERRAQLLESALSVYAEKGLGDATHSDLAQKSGVAVPTTFHYFPTKDDLTSAVLAEVSRFLIEDVVESRYEETADATETLTDILMAFCDSIDSNPDHIRVWLEWSVAVRGDIWQKYLEFYHQALRGVTMVTERGLRDGSIRTNVNVEVASRVIVGGAHMVAQMKFADCSRETISETCSSLVQGCLGSQVTATG